MTIYLIISTLYLSNSVDELRVFACVVGCRNTQPFQILFETQGTTHQINQAEQKCSVSFTTSKKYSLAVGVGAIYRDGLKG